MTGDELVAYIKTWMSAAHGVDLAVSGVKERAVMNALRKTYGKDAGRIIKWVMARRDGKGPKDKLVTFFDFQREAKWWTDQVHIEMQVQSRQEDEREKAPRLTRLSALR